MRKVFFIDSENVGDSWISLLDTVTDDDEILVFYTAKSPHISYKNAILLKNSSKKVSFIECFEGSNALDFQLCTELGYRVHNIADDEFVIVTNDSGFDAAVKYWKKRNIPVSRIRGAECTQETTPNAKSQEDTSPAKTAVSVETKPANKARKYTAEELKAMEILYIIGRNDLGLLHLALQQLFGANKGNEYYKEFKSDPDSEYTDFIKNHIFLPVSEKRNRYCSIAFELNHVKMPKDFPDFVLKTWRKKSNLNSFRSALLTQYGKDKYESYYSIIKAHVKILDIIK